MFNVKYFIKKLSISIDRTVSLIGIKIGFNFWVRFREHPTREIYQLHNLEAKHSSK